MKWNGLAGALATTLLGSVALPLLIAAGNTVTQVTELYLGTKRAYNQVVLLNHVKEAISQGEVVFGQRYRFQRLAVGDTAQISIPAGGEGRYAVHDLFQSGKRLSSDEPGYFTSSALAFGRAGVVTLLEKNLQLSVQEFLLNGWTFLALTTIVLVCVIGRNPNLKMERINTIIAALRTAMAISAIVLILLFSATSIESIIRDPRLLFVAPHLLIGAVILPLVQTTRPEAWFELLLCAIATILAIYWQSALRSLS